MSLEEAIKETDRLKEVRGIKFIVDDHLDESYDYVTVDYGTKFFRKGYIIALDNDQGGGC